MLSLSEARPPLGAADRLALLQLARDSVVEAVCRDGLPRYLRNDGIFGQRCGVFVTLHVRRRLRGCIGVVESVPSGVPLPSSLSASQPTRDDEEPSQTIEPLGHSIVRCAATAAVCDPRFPRLRPEELPDLQIELSLLSTPQPIRPEAIELGRHGLLIRSWSTSVIPNPAPVCGDGGEGPAVSGHVKGGSDNSPIKQGLLLPQVAIEHRLTIDQFLAETCRKAGLPPDAWQLPSTQLLAFTCEIFSESPKDRHPEPSPGLWGWG